MSTDPTPHPAIEHDDLDDILLSLTRWVAEQDSPQMRIRCSTGALSQISRATRVIGMARADALLEIYDNPNYSVTFNKLGTLFGLSSSRIHIMVNKARERASRAEYKEQWAHLLEGDD